MSEFEWSVKLDIGLSHIDEQHRELIALFNGLMQAMIHGLGDTVLEDTFSELKAYTEKHFGDEEEYMELVGYPGLAEQKVAHVKLIEEVEKFRGRLLSDQGVTPNETLDFINGWIVEHIKEMDAKIAEFVAEQK